MPEDNSITMTTEEERKDGRPTRKPEGFAVSAETPEIAPIWDIRSEYRAVPTPWGPVNKMIRVATGFVEGKGTVILEESERRKFLNKLGEAELALKHLRIDAESNKRARAAAENLRMMIDEHWTKAARKSRSEKRERKAKEREEPVPVPERMTE